MPSRQLLIRSLGTQPFEDTWRRMRAFTDRRDESTADELWAVEHPEVFTLGQAGREEHILDPGDIPVIRCDRGGQATYHGPGQLVVYLLLDIRHLTVKGLVAGIEAAVIKLLGEFGLTGVTRKGAPGVYVGEAKIAALGLRIRRGCSYHGLALNVSPNLERFASINPCGYEGLAVTSLERLGVSLSPQEALQRLTPHLAAQFGYDDVSFCHSHDFLHNVSHNSRKEDHRGEQEPAG